MIISCANGNLRHNKLAKKVAELILSGVSTNKILILTLNSFTKEEITSKINQYIFKNGSHGFGQLNISTFSGIAYNSILKNWLSIENIISKNDLDSEVYPTLSGLDASQYFFKKIIKEEDFDDYFSKKNLMHQLLRRYKLIVENGLSDKEVESKSALLGETFSNSAFKAIASYKLQSSKSRIFDNLKQISSFLYLLKNNKINDFDDIEYFFADDVDEYSFAAFEFCKFMIKKSKDNYIFLDKNGCSRKGYLCGYSEIYNDLKNEFNMPEKIIPSNNNMTTDAKNLFDNLILNDKKVLNNFEQFSFSKRLEMIENSVQKVEELLKEGVELSKIHIISPIIDENLIYSLKEFFKKKNIKIQLLTGNKKITEDLYVYSIITILELLNNSWEVKPTSFDIRILLNSILLIPMHDCKNYILHYEKKGILPEYEITMPQDYKNLIELINNGELKNKKISEQFDEIFSKIIAPNMKSECDFEPINLLSKSINEFEKIKIKFLKSDNIELTPIDWLIHIKNSVVSQNPSKPAHIDNNALTVSTAQKIVDFSLESDYQIWLDVTSSEWIKEDTGTIYNAWVFQKNFNENDFSSNINKTFTLEKTARLLRKLVLCTNKKIYLFSSVFDASGRENFGELLDYIEIKKEPREKFNFIPRDDQKEILNYKTGKLAVPAVPGAGKTTIMLALLIKLVENKVNPAEILVLTYMESAARNFLNRFKNVTSTTKNLPQISTIHAFAFKILMENNNYAFVNLPEDFSICDDALKTSIIKDICAKNLPVGENIDDYSSLMILAISKSKLNNITLDKTINSNDISIKEFSFIYKSYLEKLKSLSLLDYDDLLMYSVKLLKENENIKEYYQEKFKYIIEDEAQDSSPIQQELIKLLSGKYNNVIRCGDVNQAILGTFSNSDVKGFKEFISSNSKVEMFRSQRCAKGIYELANNLVNKAIGNFATQDAFYNLKMQGVEGKNPISENPVSYKIVEDTREEKEVIINDIKQKLENSEALPTFGILLRTNKQVSTWAAFLESKGLNVLCRGDSFRQKKVFTFILTAMELFMSPWNNKILAKFYKEFCNIDKFKFDEKLFEYIEKNDKTILTPDFIKLNHFTNKDFEPFWWEAFSIVESNTLDIQEIVIYCANTYFDDVIDKSNAFLFSVLIKKYLNTLDITEKFKLNYFNEMLKYFKNLLSQKTMKGINLFSKEDEDANFSGFVQIMTIHKSKGGEFDFVYIPEFTDYNYSLDFAKCCERIKNRKKPLLSKLDKIITGKEVLPSQKAKEEIDETLRLLYVGITRAKKGLAFSYSNKNDFKKDNKPVKFIEDLINYQV